MKKFLITLLVILLIAGAGVGGWYIGHLNYKVGDLQNKLNEKENNTSVNNNNVQNNTSNNTKSISGIVTELSNEVSSARGKSITFRFPQINFNNSEYAKKINDEITTLKAKAEQAKKYIAENKEYEWYANDVNYDFSYFEENGILTVIISHGFGDGDDEYKGKFYKVYNIDLSTGKEVTREELFKKAGEDINNFTNKITEYSKKYIDPTSKGSQFGELSYIRGKSLDINNCQFYVKNGHLIALVEAEGTDYGATWKIDMTNGERVR